MRVAVAIHQQDLQRVLETYHYLSLGYFIHASPTLFHAGTTVGQMSSCFLLPLDASSLKGVYRTITDCALISQGAGGIGLDVNQVPATGYVVITFAVLSHLILPSTVTETEMSSGIHPMLRIFDSSVALVSQGANKRPGALAAYIEPWHQDIFKFLDLKKNHGSDYLRARRLFYALWVPDLL